MISLKNRISLTFFVALPALAFSLNCYGQADWLSRVSELQERARLSNQGGLGCGSDYKNVFRGQAKFSDLRILLEKRAEANRTGEPNEMSGQVGDLVFVILSALPRFGDAAFIPVVEELLEDKDDIICSHAAIALFRLAEQSEELKKEIEPIIFPKQAVRIAAARGIEAPA